MFRARAAMLAAACLAGCDPAPAPMAAPSASASPTAGAIAVGDQVLAAVSKASFREGTVVTMTDSEVTFAFGRVDPKTGDKPRETVARDMAWKLGAPARVSAGRHAVCKIDMAGGRADALPSWYPCRVGATAGDTVAIEDHYGRPHELDPSSVVVPPEAVQKNIATYLDVEQRHRTFDQAFAASGSPARPPGWDPNKGDAVIIRFASASWYGGTIVEHLRDKKRVRVAYDLAVWDEREIGTDRVVPQPSAAWRGPALAPGGFVLARDPAGSPRWEHNRVATVNGDVLELDNRDGKRRSVKASDVVAIVGPQ